MEEQYISGEEYQEMQRNRPVPPGRTKSMKLPVIVGILVAAIALVFIGGWFGGAHYQKGKDVKLSLSNNRTMASSSSGDSSICVGSGPCSGTTNGPMTAQSSGGGGGPGGCAQVMTSNGTAQKLCGGAPMSGTVTAITPTSMTVQPSSGGSVQVITITSSTTIQDNGATVTYTDIKVGDTVVVIPGSTDSTQAVGIMVNPKMIESSNGGPVTTGN